MKRVLASLPLMLIALGAGYFAADAVAADAAYTLVIKDHRFEPSRLEVPAGKKLKLLVKNLDPTAEEFESHELRKELVLAPGVSRTLVLGPLKPGSYAFFGEFHPRTAKGRIVAK